MVANKAQIASSLIRALAQTSSKAEACTYAERLSELWPDIHVEYKAGLHVFFLSGAVHSLPKSLKHAALYIEEVFPDGSAKVIKKDPSAATTWVRGMPLRLKEASVPLSVFENAPPPPPGPTRYQVLMLDED